MGEDHISSGGEKSSLNSTQGCEHTTSSTIESKEMPGQANRPRPRWLVSVLLIVVVAVLAAGGYGMWRYVSFQQHQSALAECNSAVHEATKVSKSVQSAITSYKEAVGVQADQVKDATTVQVLKKSVDTAPKPNSYKVLLCSTSMSTKDLQTATSRANRLAGEYRGVDQRIRKAGKSVLASRDAKSLDDAKAGLAAKKSEAEQLLTGSDGRVADGSVRDGLQNAINQANQVTGNKVKDYQDVARGLQSAIDQVNASIQQKTQTDQQATQQSTTPTPGRNSYQLPHTQRGGNGGSGSTTTMPQGSTGGGSNWRDRLPPLDTTHHGCNPDGSCGIG